MDAETLVLLGIIGINLGYIGGCIYILWYLWRQSISSDDEDCLIQMESDLNQMDQDVSEYFRGTGTTYTSEQELYQPSRREIRQSIRRYCKRLGEAYSDTIYQDHIDDCRWMVMHAEKALDYLYQSDPESSMIFDFQKILLDAKSYIQPIRELITKLKSSDSDDEALIDNVAAELTDLHIKDITSKIIKFIHQLVQINPDDVTTLIIGDIDQ